MIRLKTTLSLLLAITCYCPPVQAQENWHNQPRELRYTPDGKDFVIQNGTRRFNRALYGTHTAFRVETGDLPEFALYLPGMGGNLRLGLIQGDSSKWLTTARTIEARYQAGSMRYVISDPILGGGSLHLKVLSLGDGEGAIFKIESEKIPQGIGLFFAFGGATGKKFSRDGDLGADPESSFDLKPEYCVDNEYVIQKNCFNLYFGSGRDRSTNERYENNYKPTQAELEQTRLLQKKRLFGLFPENSELKVVDATSQRSPSECYHSDKSLTPMLAGKVKFLPGKPLYILIMNPDSRQIPATSELQEIFEKAEAARLLLANRITIETPDPFINAAGASLSTAADAVWDGQSFMHGAIAWRMPLNGWRGAYAADWLGWHDRARTHFDGYFKAQYVEPPFGPSVPDSATNLARQKEKTGTSLFTDGYISRSPGKINPPHHYDMNLVFIDQLLSHFRWTGDLDYLRKSWPVLERHLAWEKRNFDANNDGLYDAYCCIWASDALQYSGGGVTHSSAYNFRANQMAAELAVLIGKDPKPYLQEAEKIKNAVNRHLWLPGKGWFAENKDLLGNRLVHPAAALWTVYHAIDEGLADPFQAYQTTKYVDNMIPHIPIRAKGLSDANLFTLSTTNWMPYSWSINSVASGEVLHTALAFWQTGRSEEAFQLTRSLFIDYMFLGSSPGNFGQLSFYDAFRGELYRDFADAIGVSSRALVEGLFGVMPDLLRNTLTVRPGWPANWPYARLETPDIKIDYQKAGSKDIYHIGSKFSSTIKLQLQVKAKLDDVKSVKINGKVAEWKLLEEAIEMPELQITTGKGSTFDIEIEWTGKVPERLLTNSYYAEGDTLALDFKEAKMLKVYDPQLVFSGVNSGDRYLQAELKGELGGRCAFIKLHQGKMKWWHPVTFELRKVVELIYDKVQPKNTLSFAVRNNTVRAFEGAVGVHGFKQKLKLPARTTSSEIRVNPDFLVPGSNNVEIKSDTTRVIDRIIQWDIVKMSSVRYESIDLEGKFNDRITNIFREQYFSPRSPYPTLSIPIQGIGDWCSFKETAVIDDIGLRNVAGHNGRITTPQGILFAVSGKEIPNILFTSKWDNYPDSIRLDLSGKASHLYLLMAGSGHHMQSRMENGVISVEYMDGTKEHLFLKSPDNWWPIEQDFYEDGYAFKVDAVRPLRLYLKTGAWHQDTYDVWSKNKTRKIEGGAASVLDLSLNPNKELKQVTLETLTNDVVIGLMAATLVR